MQITVADKIHENSLSISFKQQVQGVLMACNPFVLICHFFFLIATSLLSSLKVTLSQVTSIKSSVC